MAKRLIVLDYDAVRQAFNKEFKSTRKLIESGETHLDNLAEGFTEADRVLRKMLTEDVVEVVRCKDCSKWMPEFGGCREFTTKRLPTGGKKVFVTKPDDFCSYGERKEG